MDDIPFTLPNPEWEQYTWLYENEHGPASQPPLVREGFIFSSRPGDGPPSQIVVNGYTYIRADESGHISSPFRYRDLGGQSPLEVWRQKWLPQAAALFDTLMAFDARTVAPGQWRTTIRKQEVDMGRVMSGVHGECVFAPAIAAQRFIESYVDRFGEDARSDALALLQGFENRTVDRALALWELSRQVVADPALHRLVVLALEGAGRGIRHDDFTRRLDAFLDEFGYTIDSQVVDAPTWHEDPRQALTIILRYAGEPDEAAPSQAAAAQRSRREELELQLKAAAKSDGAAASLLQQLPQAQELLPVREDHNALCDQRLLAASRHRWLSAGSVLKAQDLVADAGDVFYFEPEDLYVALEERRAPSAETIARRRAEQARYRAVSPPTVLGKPRLSRRATESDLVRGRGASAGVYRGRARVIRELAEAERLEPGDVLVCGVTAPSWTPYFALVGAVVTDGGDALSHTAVIAREYGIPAVVGTRTGSRVIPDGAVIQVDGTSGEVRIES